MTASIVNSAHAFGLAELRVQSGLGQPLKSQVSLIGSDNAEINPVCIRARLESAEGVFLAQANIAINQNSQNRIIFLTTRQGIQEPAVKVIVDINCETQLHREFFILLDPPQFLPAQIKSDTLIDQPNDATSAISAASVQGQAGGVNKILRTRTRPVSENKSMPPPTATVPRLSPAQATKTIKKPRDVLKLSDDAPILQQGLKISDSLPSSLERQLVENTAELRAAQAHMASILRGESADLAVQPEQTADKKKIQALQNEAAQLKRQNLVDKRALDDVKRSSYPQNWLIGISAIAFAGFVIALLLLIYIRRLHLASETSWWEQGKDKKDAKRRQNIEDLVNNVQASYEPHEPSVFEISHLTAEASPVESLASAKQLTDRLGSNAGTGNPDDIFQPNPVRGHALTLEDTNSSTFNFFSTRGSSVNVEEISDVTQEAEFWMSVNDPQRAIEILEPQANVAHPDSPVPWLYLLDLYRVVNNKEKYDGLRSRFLVFFNANIPDFETQPEKEGVRQLEDFSHLIERICAMWNGPDVIGFLQSLLVDDRDGQRCGFELPVYRDILLLISIAHDVEREKAVHGAATGGWSSVRNISAVDTNTENTKNDLGTGSIDFEVIDFPRPELPKN